MKKLGPIVGVFLIFLILSMTTFKVTVKSNNYSCLQTYSKEEFSKLVDSKKLGVIARGVNEVFMDSNDIDMWAKIEENGDICVIKQLNKSEF